MGRLFLWRFVLSADETIVLGKAERPDTRSKQRLLAIRFR